jgi:hypothetical protein
VPSTKKIQTRYCNWRTQKKSSELQKPAKAAADASIRWEQRGGFIDEEEEMARRGIRFIAVGLAAAGLTAMAFFGGTDQTRAQNSDSVEFRVGQMFPTMVFPSLEDGHPRSVADFRGKKLVLHIFASW